MLTVATGLEPTFYPSVGAAIPRYETGRS